MTTDDKTDATEATVQPDEQLIPFVPDKAPVEPETEQAAEAPVAARPAFRHLVIETDGDTLTVRNTMGLLELRSCLQMLTPQVDTEIDQKAARGQQVPPLQPATVPVPAMEPAPEPAGTSPPEPEPPEEQEDG